MPITRRARSWAAKPAIIPACVEPVTEHTITVSKKTPSAASCSATSCAQRAKPSPPSAMVGGAGRDRVRRAAGRLDVGDRLLPALLEADPEARVHEPHVGAHQAAELDVADAVVDDVGPVDPALLHEHAAHPGARRGGRDLARVVGLHAADRDERVAALGARVGDEVLELARLVAAVGEPAVAVVALRPHVRAAELRAQPLEPVHGRRAERQRVPLEGVEAHARSIAARNRSRPPEWE